MTRHPKRPEYVLVHQYAASAYFENNGSGPSPCQECPDLGRKCNREVTCDTTQTTFRGKEGHKVWVKEITAVAIILEDGNEPA